MSLSDQSASRAIFGAAPALSEKQWHAKPSGNVNVDALRLLTMAKDEHNALHSAEAEQTILNSLRLHCPELRLLLDVEAARAETVRSIADILRYIASDKRIEVDVTEIPGIDAQGFLVALKELAVNEQAMRDKLVTCPLIDKLVFYRNAGIEAQVVDALEALRASRIYAFEVKMDILMLEHCAIVVAKMDAETYDGLFRRELRDFALGTLRLDLEATFRTLA